MTRNRARNNSLKRIGMQPIPRQVSASDLHANGLLVTDQELAALKQQARNLARGQVHYLSKSKRLIANQRAAKPNYSFLVDENGNLYAVYKGAKHHKHLGKGSFGKVKLGQDLQTGEFGIVKVIALTALKGATSSEDDVIQEACINQHMTGAGFWTRKPIKPKATKSNAIMFTKLATGMNFADFCKQQSMRLSLDEKLRVAIGVIDANLVVHQRGVIHRDAKHLNLVINPSNFKQVAVDFGLAYIKGEADKYEISEVGTPGFRAPEVKMYKYNNYTELSDAYGVGMILGYFFHALSLVPYGVGAAIYAPPQVESKKFQKMIPDAEVRKKVFAVIKQLTEEDRTKRMTLPQARAALLAIEKEVDFCAYRSVNIGVVDAAQLRNLSASKRQSLYKRLQAFDQIIVLGDDTKNVASFQDRKLVTEMIKAGVPCVEEGYEGRHLDNETLLSQLNEEMATQQPGLFKLFKITPRQYGESLTYLENNGDAVTVTSRSSDGCSAAIKRFYLGARVYAEDKEKIGKMLAQEQARIVEKYKNNPSQRQKRINAIDSAEANIEKNQTYADLHVALKQLETQLRHIRRYKYLPWFLQTKSHSVKVVEGVRRKLTPR